MKSTIIISLLICLSLAGRAQSDSADELAQKMQNPLASLVAIPVLHSFNSGVGPNDKVGYGVSIQPIFPFNFEKFNIINRVIFGYGYVPESSQPSTEFSEDNESGTWGISDLNYSFFVSPKTTKKIAWGVGPAINMPTASDHRLGTGKWSVGPSAVVVFQIQKLTIDMVLRQTWSVGGDANRNEVNQFVVQPLIAYGLGNGFVLSTFPTITANWDLESGQRWTIPLGGGLSKVLFLGKLPLSLSAQYYHYVVRSDMAPTSEFRFTSTFILSK